MGRVGVVNYAAGNLASVESVLKRLGAEYTVSDNPVVLQDCERIIFPGVGEARAAMGELEKRGLDRFLPEFAASGKPLLGICIGYQILLSRSEENQTPCLGIIPGEVVRFPEDRGVKIPHMGWNEVTQRGDSPLFRGIPDRSSFYFVHSYYPRPVISGERAGEIAGETEYGVKFASAYTRDNLFAVQFHPEKSGEWGIKMISNFLHLPGTFDDYSSGTPEKSSIEEERR
ncbi:MAG: imidazole glycerol phosphate synthase subunit HisH [Spirochaetaceae bacterium]